MLRSPLPEMTKQTYDDQVITQYLLGSLPEAETERLDELSFTDDEFAAVLQSAEKDLVDAYTRGELSGPTLEKFNSYYLSLPRKRERVRFAQAFQVFAEKKVTAQAAEMRKESAVSSESGQTPSRQRSVLSFFKVPRLAWQWGFAIAALALLITGSWLVFENKRLRQQVSQTAARRDELGRREQELQRELEGQRVASVQAEQELARIRGERERLEQELKQEEQRRIAEQQRATGQRQPSSPGGVSIASFILAPQMRGVGQLPEVSLPAKTDYVEMQLQLEPNDYPAYQVSLLDQSGNQTLWRSNKLKARAAGDGKALSVSFRAGLLRPQAYVLRVSGVSASGASEILSDYPFKVVK